MLIRKAQQTDLDKVFQIVQDTIQTVYPRYYPREAVAFFSDYHSKDAIVEDIEQEAVWVIENEEGIVGTGSNLGCGISRVFVLPELQGHGFGSALLDHLEAHVSLAFPSAQVDASLPAFNLYLNRGYDVVSGHEIAVDQGEILFYISMEKQLIQAVGCTPSSQEQARLHE